MAAKKLELTDERMLLLMDYAIKKEIARNETDYLNQIEFPRQNITNIKTAHSRFTRDHIYNACSLTGASVDWVYGFSNIMLRKENKPVFEKLREVVVELEAEFNKVKASKKQ